MKFMKKLSVTYIICLFLSAVMFLSEPVMCGGVSSGIPSGRLESAIAQWNGYIRHSEFDSLEYSINELVSEYGSRSEIYRYALLFRAYACLGVGNADSARAIVSYAETMADENRMPVRWNMIYNDLVGRCALASEGDYPKALDHFNKALEYGRKSGCDYYECIALCEIADIYINRNDSTGFGFVSKAVKVAERTGDVYLMALSSLQECRRFMMEGNYENAARVSQHALELSQSGSYPFLLTMSELMVARAAHLGGKYEKAEEYYGKALASSSNNDLLLRIYMHYGRLKYDKGMYDEAESMYRKGIALSGNRYYRCLDLLSGLSDIYYMRGNIDSALAFFNIYIRTQDSLFNCHNEREFSSLILKYEDALYRKELRKNERNIYLVVSVSVVILIAGICFFILYRRKNSMYRSLVEQHQQYMQMKETMSETNAGSDKDNPESGKEYELFCRIRKLLVEDGLYKNNDISLEKISEILDSNRVYVSKAINRYAKMSFYSYINSLRIEEATRILSDPEDSTPLKKLCLDLGYNSVQAFYRVFQKEIGCPPQKYKDQSRKISKNATNS